jgi:hypothetical protein
MPPRGSTVTPPPQAGMGYLCSFLWLQPDQGIFLEIPELEEFPEKENTVSAILLARGRSVRNWWLL